MLSTGWEVFFSSALQYLWLFGKVQHRPWQGWVGAGRGTYLRWSWRHCRAMRRVCPCSVRARSHLQLPQRQRWLLWCHRSRPSCGAWRRCCSSRRVDWRCSTVHAGNHPPSTGHCRPVHSQPADLRRSWSWSSRLVICCSKESITFTYICSSNGYTYLGME